MNKQRAKPTREERRQERVILHLFDDGWTPEEIAKVLGMALGDVLSVVLRELVGRRKSA